MRDLHEAHVRQDWDTKRCAFERAVGALASAFEHGARGTDFRTARVWLRAQFGGVTLHAWSRLNAGDKLASLAEGAGLPYLVSYQLVGRQAWSRAEARLREEAAK